MTIIPPIVPPLPVDKRFDRHLTPRNTVEWLREGWRD